MNSPIPADPGAGTCQGTSLNTSPQDGHRPAWRKPGIEVLPLSLTRLQNNTGNDGDGSTTGAVPPPAS